MFEGIDSGSAMRRIEDRQGGFEDRLRPTRELSGRLADSCVHESSEDGLIEVSVGSRGELCDLALGEGVRRRAATETAREILRISVTTGSSICPERRRHVDGGGRMRGRWRYRVRR